MSNYVHPVIRLIDEIEIEKSFYLQQIIQSIKRFSAMESNKLLGAIGSPFRQKESYDRLISNANCRESRCMY